MQTTIQQKQTKTTGKKRAEKGSVQLQTRNKSRRYKFTANRIPQTLRLEKKGYHTKAFERALKKTLELDIAQNTYDFTQARYKEMLKNGVVPVNRPVATVPPATPAVLMVSPVAVATLVPVAATIPKPSQIIAKVVHLPIAPATTPQEPIAAPQTETGELYTLTETAPETAPESVTPGTEPATPGTQEKKESGYKRRKREGTQPIPFVDCPRLDQPFYLKDLIIYYCQQNGRNHNKKHYYTVIDMVEKWGKVQLTHIPLLLENENYKYFTYKSRRGMLWKMFEVLRENKTIEKNPFANTPQHDAPTEKPEERQRISDAQMGEVLDAIKNDSYFPVDSRKFKHSDYYPFIYFLAVVGTRPAEAIGLQVKKINFEECTITINEAFARENGTSQAGRIMKDTKTKTKRVVGFDCPELLDLLKQQCAGKKPNDYVFINPKGTTINDVEANKVLQAVLSAKEMTHKVLYFLRHCFVSRCVQQGLSILEIMKLVGHADERMILRVYAEITGIVVKIPRLNRANKK